MIEFDKLLPSNNPVAEAEPCPCCRDTTLAPEPELTSIDICHVRIPLEAVVATDAFSQNASVLSKYQESSKLSNDLFRVHTEEAVEHVNTWELAYREVLLQAGKAVFDLHVSEQAQGIAQSSTELFDLDPKVLQLLQQVCFGPLVRMEPILMDAIHLENVRGHHPSGLEARITKSRVAKRLQVNQSTYRTVKKLLPQAMRNLTTTYN